MLTSVTFGSTSVMLVVKLSDATSATGGGITALTNASSGLAIALRADNEAAATAYSGSNITGAGAVGTNTPPATGKIDFLKVDDTNMPGHYQLLFVNTRFSVAGAKRLYGCIKGVTNLVQCDFEIDLPTVDIWSAGGKLAATLAAADVSGNLPAVVEAYGTNQGPLYLMTGGAKQLVVNVDTGDVNANLAAVDSANTTEFFQANSGYGANTVVPDNATIGTIATNVAAVMGDGFDTSTDSLHAIRARGDAAWITGSGGGSSLTSNDVKAAVDASATGVRVLANLDAKSSLITGGTGQPDQILIGGGEGTPPRYYGRLAIATQILNGSCVLWHIGDSIGCRLGGTMAQVWPVKTVGVCGSGYTDTDQDGYGFGLYGGYYPIAPSQGIQFGNSSGADDPDPDYGYVAYPAGKWAKYASGGVTPYPGGTNTNGNLLLTNILTAALRPKHWYSNDWIGTAAATGPIHVRIVMLAHPTAPTNSVYLRLRTGETILATTSAMSFVAPTPTYQIVDWDIPEGTDLSAGPSLEWAYANGATVTAATKLIQCAPTRIWTGAAGFTHFNCSIAGLNSTQFLDDTRFVPAVWATIVQAVGVTHGMIMLGANGPNDKATFKAETIALIAKARAAAGFDLPIVLVATYAFNPATTTQADQRDACYEIAQTDNNVLFLNLHDAFPDAVIATGTTAGYSAMWNGASSQLFLDTVHPNVQGAYLINATLAGLLSDAAADAISYATELAAASSRQSPASGGPASVLNVPGTLDYQDLSDVIDQIGSGPKQ